MPRVRFLADFDWRPPERNGRVTIAFKAGWEGTVRTACAADAVAQGKAVRVPRQEHEETA